MADPIQLCRDALAQSKEEHARAKKARTRRDNRDAPLILSKIDDYTISCPESQVLVVLQSAHSQKLTVKVGGPMVIDGVFVSKLVTDVVAAIRAKSLEPDKPYPVTHGGGSDGYAALEESLAEAARRGDITRKQVDSVLQTSKELHAGERWVLLHACLNLRCRCA